MRSLRHLIPIAVTMLVAATVLSLGSGVQRAGAQATQSWSITPAGGSPDQPGTRPDLTYTVDPGTTISDTVQVWNYGDEPIELKVYAADALITTEGAYDLQPSTTAPTDVASWTRIGSERVTLKPKSVTALAVTITVPKDATPGDHAGGIVASTATPQTGADGAQVLVEKRVGTRLNVRVSGDVVPAAQIKDVHMTYRTSLNPVAPGSVEVSYTIINSGNTKLGGRVQLELSGPLGLLSRTVELPSVPVTMPGNVLQQKVIVPDVWPTLLVSGKLTFIPNDDPQVADISSTAKVSTSASTFALPIGQILAALVVGLLVVVFRRRRRRKAAMMADLKRRAAAADVLGNTVDA